MSEKPEILAINTIARSKIFQVEQVDLRFSNGAQVSYERLKGSSGAVMVAPMLDDDTVLLVREYAVGVHRYELGLPKGRIEADEDLLAAANRELMEEVGYGARQLSHVTTLTLAPGYLGHHTHLVLARQLYEQQLPGDEPEALEVVPWRLSELPALLLREDCTEARSIAALFMVRDGLTEGSSNFGDR